ncbi:MAG TPA: hypothetical protein VFC31_12770 [Candidatus Limnocylindria bacterium]|nr:hypothetical protein [Candidatus Limnocylindria bacterium]
MAVTAARLEDLAAWCETTPDLEEDRQVAWRRFFAEDDPRPVRYWPGAGDRTSRLCRFLGWFMFSYELPQGDRPAARAVRALYGSDARDDVMRAVRAARYALCVVTSVLPSRAVVLELEEERFEVRDRRLSRALNANASLCAYLVPTGRRGQWLVGPGWLEWPIRIGPNMRQNLRRLQPDPLDVERLLQSRAAAEDERRSRPPQDTSLEDAVARMTAAAEAAGRSRLVMAASDWQALVLAHLEGLDAIGFNEKVAELAGPSDSVEDLDPWLQLAMNIRNATPQPDRGGKTAYELARQGS